MAGIDGRSRPRRTEVLVVLLMVAALAACTSDPSPSSTDASSRPTSSTAEPTPSRFASVVDMDPCGVLTTAEQQDLQVQPGPPSPGENFDSCSWLLGPGFSLFDVRLWRRSASFATAVLSDKSNPVFKNLLIAQVRPTSVNGRPALQYRRQSEGMPRAHAASSSSSTMPRRSRSSGMSGHHARVIRTRISGTGPSPRSRPSCRRVDNLPPSAAVPASGYSQAITRPLRAVREQVNAHRHIRTSAPGPHGVTGGQQPGSSKDGFPAARPATGANAEERKLGAEGHARQVTALCLRPSWFRTGVLMCVVGGLFADAMRAGTVSGWRRGWRVLIIWVPGCAPHGEREQLLDADTVARLRALVLWARRDPRVDNYRYWRWRERDPTGDPVHCPACGRDYVPVQIRDTDCTCGEGHRTWRHGGNCPDVVVPPRGPGCGPLPRESGDLRVDVWSRWRG